MLSETIAKLLPLIVQQGIKTAGTVLAEKMFDDRQWEREQYMRMIDEKLKELDRIISTNEIRREAIERYNETGDIDEILRHLREVGRRLECPICRHMVVNTAEYLLKYDAVRKLRKSNPDAKVSDLTDEQLRVIDEKIKQLKRDLGIENDREREQKAKDKYREILTKSVLEVS